MAVYDERRGAAGVVDGQQGAISLLLTPVVQFTIGTHQNVGLPGPLLCGRGTFSPSLLNP